MKSILISIKPKYVAKILNGEKTIEIRKTMPKCDLPIDVYIYCTKEEELFYNRDTQKWVATKNRKNVKILSNGVVKAKFTLNKVEETIYDHDEREEWYATKTLNDKELEKQSCLSYEELDCYLKGNGYAWHISNLEIFDKPKELNEFVHYNKPSCESCPFVYTADCDYYKEVECDDIPLTKAPQSWCYVEE